MRQRILLGALGVLILIFVPVYWSVLTGSGTKDNLAGPKSLLPSLPPKGPATGGSDAEGPLLLETREPKYDDRSVDRGILLREIIRQAALIAAREEMGLLTRDRSIREPLANEANPKNVPLEVLVYPRTNGEVEAVIFRQNGSEWKSLWEGKWDGRPDMYGKMVAQAEALSRSEFVQTLEKAGFRKTAAPAARDSADAPQEAMGFLKELSVPGQFAAIRMLHAEIRNSGESPELLGALSQAYATLGVLIEHLWTPAHKAFKARALLYAERAVNRWPHSALALRHRGYARALTGLHKAALDDFSSAAAVKTNGKAAASLPDWVELTGAYCRFDRDALEKAAEDEDQAPLARLLELMMAEVSGNERELWEAALALAKAAPNCLRAIDGGAIIREVGAQRYLAAMGPMMSQRVLIHDLARIPDLPSEVAELVDKYERGRKVEGIARAMGIEPPEEMPIRLQVIEQLKKSGSPDSEKQDPSWQMLGQLLEEINFIQAWRQIDVAAKVLGVPADDDIENIWPQIEHHPYAQFVASFRSDTSKKNEALLALSQSIDNCELEFRELIMGRRLADAGHDMPPGRFFVTAWHQDGVAGDIRTSMNMTAGRDEHYAAALYEVSPYMPSAVAAIIKHGIGSSRDEIEKFEKQYANSPAVQLTLAKHYLDENREVDAIRCYAAAGKVDPRASTYCSLAEIYLKRGDEEKWLATLHEFLETRQLGLGTANVQIRIADHFIERRDWEKARPYADAAAVAYSCAALRKAAQCSEAMQDWEAAEQYNEAISRRYNTAGGFEWYMFCKRTGRGDEAGSLKVAQESIEEARKNHDLNWFNAGMLYYLSDRLPEAVEAFRTAYVSDDTAVAIGVRAAVILDQLGDVSARDELLADIQKKDAPALPPVQQPYFDLATLIQQDLAAGGGGTIDRKTLDQVVAKGGMPGVQTGLAHVAACYLKQHGQSERAIDLWKSRMADIEFAGLSRTLSGAELLKQGIKPEDYKEAIWKKPESSAQSAAVQN